MSLKPSRRPTRTSCNVSWTSPARGRQQSSLLKSSWSPSDRGSSTSTHQVCHPRGSAGHPERGVLLGACGISDSAAWGSVSHASGDVAPTEGRRRGITSSTP
jgi:hypothetical protein